MVRPVPSARTLARYALLGLAVAGAACLEPNARFDGPATEAGSGGAAGLPTTSSRTTGSGTVGSASAGGVTSAGSASAGGTTTSGGTGAPGGTTGMATGTAGASGGGVTGGCPPGQVFCPVDTGGEACANIQVDPNHCGECGNACDADETCMGGECKGG